jgi:hypothetical protein
MTKTRAQTLRHDFFHHSTEPWRLRIFWAVYPWGGILLDFLGLGVHLASTYARRLHKSDVEMIDDLIWDELTKCTITACLIPTRGTLTKL